jgi:ribonuclease E
MLTQIHQPVVPLKSGGYLVINQTEALVAIDVNSGRATKERNVEADRVQDQLEAAVEAARQLRLRDLAGLIVIDFIDMDESKNNRTVEKHAEGRPVQGPRPHPDGPISGFGLMEISRQRRRLGVIEGATEVCPHCQGAGRVRSAESAALMVLRAVDIEAGKNGAGSVNLRVCTAVALYILNHKRDYLQHLLLPARPERGHPDRRQPRSGRERHRAHRDQRGLRPRRKPTIALHRPAHDGFDDSAFDDEDEDDDEIIDDDDAEDLDREDSDDDEPRERPKSRTASGRGRGRRRRGGRRDEEAPPPRPTPAPRPPQDDDDDDSEGGRRRRRGRRGGRRCVRKAATPPARSFFWVRGRTPSLDDPYVWFDPINPERAPARPEDAARAPLRADVDEASANVPRANRRRARWAVRAVVVAVVAVGIVAPRPA